VRLEGLKLVVPARESLLVLLAGLGVFFAADDQTSVVAVIPQIANDIGLAQDDFYRAAWLVNGYILGYVVVMPLIGRVADTFGHGRLFALALGLFTAGSAWVALSDDLTMLAVARSVQAVGAGAVVPVAMAIVLDYAAPERRAIGLGLMAFASEGGALVGPLWGGGIADLLGWRAVFWLNLPLCLPLAIAIWRLAPPRKAAWQGIDLRGGLLLAASLICLTIALTDDPISPRDTVTTLLLFGGALLFTALFLVSQLRTPQPMVDLALLAQRRLSAGLVTNLLTGGTLIVALVTVPLFTNVILGGSALDGGLNLMRLTVALALGALAGGFVTDRYGARACASAGVILAGAGFLGMSRWSDDPSFIVFTLPLLLGGLGFGLVIAPVNAAALAEAPDADRATVASLLTVARLLGALVGVALLTTRGLGGFYADAGLIPLTEPAYEALVRALQVGSFQDTFLVAAIVCFLTLVPAFFLQEHG
jgi:EmrB/QacA subfamily drug resistance transporter